MRGNDISRSKRHTTPTIVAISGDRLRERLLDALTLDENGFDVIVVESISRGYSRVKQLKPLFVVVFLEIDDSDACQLLAMLKLDDDLCGIPVVTCVASWQGGACVNIGAGRMHAPDKAVAVRAN